jgi:hypothetical protein
MKVTNYTRHLYLISSVLSLVLVMGLIPSSLSFTAKAETSNYNTNQSTNVTAAINYSNKILAKNPNNVYALTLKGVVLTDLRNYTGAIGYLESSSYKS